MSTEETFNEALGEVINSMVNRFRKERQQSEPWKDLFKASEKGLLQLLSNANHQIGSIILDVSDMIEEKFNIKVSKKLYDLIKALPFAMWELRTNIQNEDGSCCCADKARQIYYEEVLAEIKKLQNERR